MVSAIGTGKLHVHPLEDTRLPQHAPRAAEQTSKQERTCRPDDETKAHTSKDYMPKRSSRYIRRLSANGALLAWKWLLLANTNLETPPLNRSSSGTKLITPAYSEFLFPKFYLVCYHWQTEDPNVLYGTMSHIDLVFSAMFYLTPSIRRCILLLKPLLL